MVFEIEELLEWRRDLLLGCTLHEDTRELSLGGLNDAQDLNKLLYMTIQIINVCLICW